MNADVPQPRDIHPSKAAAFRSGTATPTALAVGPSGSRVEALEQEIKNMKATMAQQSRQMVSQGQAIADLLEEVKTLRAKTGLKQN